MKLTSLGFDLKKSNINKPIKVQSQLKQSNTSILNELAVPSAKLLQTYNKVSFKGDEKQSFDFSTLTAKSNYQVYRTMFPVFNSFQNGVMKNQKFADLFNGYTVDEIVTLFDEVIINQQEQNFSKLVNAGKNLPELSRNLSFKEAKDLTLNGILKNADIQNYLTLVDDNDYSPEIALSAIKYGLSQKDIIRLEELSNRLFNENRRLTQEEAVTCLAYNFDKKEQIQSFIDRLEKDYFGNRLGLFDAALCTVHNLNDTETKKFFELKSKQLPYKREDGTDAVYALSSQEAILCTKAELNDDELNRYAELKNKPYMYSAVRDNNSSKEPSVELIISFIKDKQTDEEIASLAEFGFKNKQQFEDFQEILNVFGYNSVVDVHIQTLEKLVYLAKLQDENGKNFFRNDEGMIDFTGFDSIDLNSIVSAKLSSLQQIQDYKEISSILRTTLKGQICDIHIIAAKLVLLQDKNSQNMYRNKEGKIDLSEFSMDDFYDFSFGFLKRKQKQNFRNSIQDFKEILTVLKSTYTDVHHIAIGRIATRLAFHRDENGQNAYRNKENKFDFEGLSIIDIEEISRQYFIDVSIPDYLDIISALKTITKKEEDINDCDVSAKLTKFVDENGKNIFRNNEGKIDFNGLGIDDIYTIARSININPTQSNDFKEILYVLKNFPDNENYPIVYLAAFLSKIQDENGKNIFRNNENKIDFNGLTMDGIIAKSTKYLTLNLKENFRNILWFLKKTSSRKESCYIELIKTNLTNFLNENGENIYGKDENNIDFAEFNLDDFYMILYEKVKPSQIMDYREILSILKTMPKDRNYDLQRIAAELARFQDENGKNMFKDRENHFCFGKLGINELSSMYIYISPFFKQHYNARYYTPAQCQNYRYLTTTLGIAPENAIYIAQDEELMERFKLVNPNIFWEGATGELKETFELFDSVLCSDNITGNRLKESDFDTELSEDYSFNFGTLRFAPTDATKQSYSVSLQKATKESSPILIAKNQGGEKETYIAYDGAIALLRELRTLTQDEKGILKEDLSSHSHFSTEEINALSEAARHFIIDIIDDNGECIISKGIDGIAEPFIGKKLSTNETKDKYKDILQKLHSDSNSPNITIENILKLIPKDATIQIRPYTTNYNASHKMLYSISSEWRDSEGKKWDLRVHSEDLKHIGKSWIYRLGYQDLATGAGSLEPLYYDNKQNDFVRGSTNPITHIKIDNGLDDYENKLISNPYFQEIIRKISTSFNKIQKIDSIASELDIHTADKKQKKDEIIAKCQQDAGYYHKYKKVVDNLLREKGFLPFSSVA